MHYNDAGLVYGECKVVNNYDSVVDVVGTLVHFTVLPTSVAQPVRVYKPLPATT